MSTSNGNPPGATAKVKLWVNLHLPFSAQIMPSASPLVLPGHPVSASKVRTVLAGEATLKVEAFAGENHQVMVIQVQRIAQKVAQGLAQMRGPIGMYHEVFDLLVQQFGAERDVVINGYSKDVTTLRPDGQMDIGPSLHRYHVAGRGEVGPTDLQIMYNIVASARLMWTIDAGEAVIAAEGLTRWGGASADPAAACMAYALYGAGFRQRVTSEEASNDGAER